MRDSGLHVVAHVAGMDSCRYAKHIAMSILVHPSTDIGDDSSPQCRCGFFFFTKTTHKGRLLFIIPCVFWDFVVVIVALMGFCICAKAHRSTSASASQRWHRGCFVSLHAALLC